MDFAKKVLADNWPDWNIVEQIGEGSYGRVYKIERETLGIKQYEALKIIRISLNGSKDGFAISIDDKSYVNEIISEIKTMTELKGNTNIVSYEDHKVIEDKDGEGWTILIRMELLTPLNKYMAEKELTNEDVKRIGIDVCRALEVCHKRRIIHRDIKLENILISENGDFKLGDFGTARNVERTVSTLDFAGTLPYIAPEIVKCEPYGRKADIYSLGILLYNLLNNNRFPFYPPYPEKVKYEDKQKAYTKRLSGAKMTKPCKADDKMTSIILKACEYDSKKRFENAEEMRKALEGEKPPKPPVAKIVMGAVIAVLVIALGAFAIKYFSDNSGKNPDDGVSQTVSSEENVAEWKKQYSEKLQEIIDGDYLINAVYINDVNGDGIPVVAISTNYANHRIPSVIFDYKDGKLVAKYDIDNLSSGDSVIDKVYFCKGSDSFVYRSYGNTQGTVASNAQEIYNISDFGSYTVQSKNEVALSPELEAKSASLQDNGDLTEYQEYIISEQDKKLEEHFGKDLQLIDYSLAMQDFGQPDSARNDKAIVAYLNTKLGLSLKLKGKESSNAASLSTGKCGANAEWIYDESEKSLVICGKGAVTEFKGLDAFKREITSVTVLSGITAIGEKAFYGFVSANKISLPFGIEKIGFNAFSDTAFYRETSFGENAVYIGDYLVYGGTSLSGPYSVNEGTLLIADKAFSSAYIEEIKIPYGVIIGEEAFANSPTLKKVTIEGNCKISENAFKNCPEIESVIFGSEMKLSDLEYFKDTEYYKSRTVENGITYLDKYIIAVDSGIGGNCVIKSGVEVIDSSMFANTRITSLRIPASVVSIKCGDEEVTGPVKYSFGNSLKEITVDEANTRFSSKNGVLYNKDQTVIIEYPPQKTDEDFIIDDRVTDIGLALVNNNYIKTLYIGGRVDAIAYGSDDGKNSGAFGGCYSIEKFEVSPSNPNYFADEFGVLYTRNKTVLIKYPSGNTREEFVVPDSVESIATNALSDISYLKRLYIGTNIRSIAYSNSKNASITAHFAGSSELFGEINHYKFADVKYNVSVFPDIQAETTQHETVPETTRRVWLFSRS